MINPAIQQIIHECLEEMRSYDPKWEKDDIFYSACGSVLKYAESQGQDATPELLAAIQVAVREEME